MSQPPVDPSPPSPTDRYAKLAIHLMLLALGLLVIVVAVQELRTRGTEGVSGLSIANYRAQAKADDRPAPAFAMPALRGSGTIALEEYTGKVVALNFWASWCAPCRQEAPGLQDTWQDYRSRGVQFLGVDYRDDRAAARAFQGEFGITYPSVYDPAGKLAYDYGLIGLPTTFIIDREGRIAYQFVGYTDATLLKSALDDVVGRGRA